MWIRVLLGAVFFVSAVWVGIVVLRGLARPVEEDGEIDTTDVEADDVRFRCSICGMEMRMTLSPGEDFKAPRHCREEMVPAS